MCVCICVMGRLVRSLWGSSFFVMVPIHHQHLVCSLPYILSISSSGWKETKTQAVSGCICSFTPPSPFLSVFISFYVGGYFTFFFWQSSTSTPLFTSLPSSTTLPPLSPPPLTQQRMESWGEKSWRQARIISYICPHFLQKMIDLANYPMLPSLSHTTSGRRYGGNQRSLGVCRIADAIWLFMSPESKEKRKYQILSWLYVDVIVLEMILMMHVLCLLLPSAQKMSLEETWWAVPPQLNVSRSRWKQRSGPKSRLNPKPFQVVWCCFFFYTYTCSNVFVRSCSRASSDADLRDKSEL